MVTVSNMSTLLDGLRRPAAYDHAITGFSVVETHISWVVLTGAYAYKIKKPVNLGFVDFSTLEQRRRCCEEEVRINRRLCPDIYEGVVPITGSPSSPTVDGTGEPFEYAVRMKQFDEDLLWDRMLSRGELGPGLIDELASIVAQAHAAAAVAPGDSRFGSADLFKASLRSTVASLETFVDEKRQSDLLSDVAARLDNECRAQAGPMENRRRDGFVREGHGDMHLRNIALRSRDDRTILLFDALEFDEELRWIDVINDVAFLFMDLEHRNRSDLAWRFLNAYVERTGDYPGLAFLRLFAANRALVRAKVAAIQRHQGRPDGRPRFPAETAVLVDLARRYAVPAPPRLYITHGLSASGKTTGTQVLLERIGAVRLRSDVERKRLFGLASHEVSPEPLKAVMYGPSATERTYERLRTLARTLLDAGQNVIVDAAFLKRNLRQSFQELAGERRVSFRIMDFRCPEDVLRSRIRQRWELRSDASEADLEVLRGQILTREDLTTEERRMAVSWNERSIDAAL